MAGILRLERAAGTVDGVNRDFIAPVGFIPGTAKILRNGKLGDRLSDNGWEEVDASAGTFRMKIAPISSQRADDPGDIIDIFFEAESGLVGGGADGGVPVINSATLFEPKLIAALGLSPKVVSAVNLSDPKPPKIGADELKPDIVSADDLVPKIVSAKDVT